MDVNENIRVLGIAGSLRTGSYNAALLRAVAGMTPDGMSFIIAGLADIPAYNYDIEKIGDPPAVGVLKDAMANADAFLIVTPEYQHGIPGVLKNALDWAARPPKHSPMLGKAAAVMGATEGTTGTARAQEQVRQTLAFSEVYLVPGPEVLVGHVQEKIDRNGVFSDESATPFIRELLNNLANLALALREFPPNGRT
jgi:chromate reductase